MKKKPPIPPEIIKYGKVSLHLERTEPGNNTKGFVSGYHYRIRNRSGMDVGFINYRVGNTPHIVNCAGHIGYEIYPMHRGHHYAYQACQAIAHFVAQVSGAVIITTDPGNLASIRTIEKLGAEFLEERPVPESDPHYATGSRVKRRYRWIPF